MRYIIETKKDNLPQVLSDQGLSGIKIVDKYEPLEKIAASVERVGLALREFKNGGVSESVFFYYLKGKGHTEKEINAIMGDVKGFFTQIGILTE